jgi:DNA primase
VALINRNAVNSVNLVNLPDLKARLDCRDLADRYYNLRRVSQSGKCWLFHRPGHTEHKPSFGVYRDGYRDFATGQSGDTLAFIQRVENVDFRRALEIAAELAGLLPRVAATPPPRLTASVPNSPAAAPWLTPAWQSAASAAQAQAERDLWSDTPAARQALAYLHRRGLTDATIKAAHLGFNPAWRQTTYLKPADGKPAYLAEGLLIPTYEAGQLVALKVRRLHPSATDPKYTQLAGSHQGALYNGDALRPDLPVVLVEGEFDGLVGQQEAGHLATFVTVGSASNALKPAITQRLKQAPRLLGAPDNDPAGDAAFKRWQAVSLERLVIPAGKDLTEWFTQHGGNVAQWVSEALAQPGPTAAPLAMPAPAEIPPDIAAPMLLCGFDAALVYLRAARLGYLESLPRASRFRGKRQLDSLLAVPGVSKADTDLSPKQVSHKENLAGDLVSGFETLPSWSQIRAALQPLLKARLIEFCYPLKGADPSLPDPDLPLNGHTVGDEVWPELGADERAALETAARTQDAALAGLHRRRYLFARQFVQFTKLAGGVLPADPKNGPEYAAYLLRAVHDANPDCDLSRFEMGLLTGRRPQNIESVLARAGLENVAQADEWVRLPGAAKVRLAACQAARGKGQIAGIVARADQGQAESRALDAPDLQPWAEAQAQAGRKLEVRLRRRAKQQVVGAVQPTKPRERKPVATGDNDQGAVQEPIQPEAENSTPEPRAVSIPRPPRYTGPGLAPDWKAAYRREAERRRDQAAGCLSTVVSGEPFASEEDAPWRSWFAALKAGQPQPSDDEKPRSQGWTISES